MAVNKQPIFTATPVLYVKRFAQNTFGAFNPLSADSNSNTIFQATSSEGTLVERITITPAASPSADYNNISSKLIYLIIKDASQDASAILATKKWTELDMGNELVELPYWQITFTGGLLLENNDSLLINQVLLNGDNPSGDGDGITVTLEGSTYTAP